MRNSASDPGTGSCSGRGSGSCSGRGTSPYVGPGSSPYSGRGSGPYVGPGSSPGSSSTFNGQSSIFYFYSGPDSGTGSVFGFSSGSGSGFSYNSGPGSGSGSSHNSDFGSVSDYGSGPGSGSDSDSGSGSGRGSDPGPGSVFVSGKEPAFGVFNSTGKLLAGNKGFTEYSELAKKLDIKRSALYMETGINGVLLGCSLLAKIKLGREERVAFIMRVPQEKLDREGSWLRKFYKEAKARTEALETIQYEVIGLWSAGDLDLPESIDFPGFSRSKDYRNSRESTFRSRESTFRSREFASDKPFSGSRDLPVSRDSQGPGGSLPGSKGSFPYPEKFPERPLAGSLAYPAGALLSNRQVSVRTSRLEDGLVLFFCLVSGLKPAFHLPFSFALSLFPAEADLSAGPGEPEPDFFLENLDLRFNPLSEGEGAPCPLEYYSFLYRAFIRMAEKQDFPVYNGSFRENVRNREELLEEIRKWMIGHFGPEVSEVFVAKGEIETLFELYSDRPEALKELADSLVARGWAERVFVFRNKELAAEVIKKLAGTASVSKGLEAFMLELYRGLNSSEKAEVQRYLLENALFYESFASELPLLLEESYRRGEPSPYLLSVTANVSFYENLEGRRTLVRGFSKGFDPLSPAEAVGLLKHALSTLPFAGEGGILLLKTLIGQKASAYRPPDKRATGSSDDFVLELTEKQAEKLDSWLGSNYAGARDEKVHTRRRKLMKRFSILILIILALAALGAFAFAFFGLSFS